MRHLAENSRATQQAGHRLNRSVISERVNHHVATRLSLLLALLLASTAQGQLSAAKSYPSSPDKAVGVVIADSPGGWLIFAVPAMLPVQSEPINGGAGILWEGGAGKYLILYFPPGQAFPQPEVTIRELGIVSPADPPPDDPSDPTKPPPLMKATAVVYVYEKDNNSVPRPVASALQQINAAGSVVASEFERDTTDGDGDTPDQFKVALDAAVKIGLPCLVVLSGDRVLRTVKAPTTVEQVTEALQ